MVSGWDKSPEPNNDYAGPPVTRKEVIVSVVTVLIIAAGIGFFLYAAGSP